MDANGAISSGSLRRPGKVVVGRPSADDLDVRSIRLNADSLRVGFCAVTQQSFADAIGVPVKTLRNWEQGRRKPTGPALVLLSLIQRDPWIVFDVMNGQHRVSSHNGAKPAGASDQNLRRANYEMDETGGKSL